MGKWTFSGRKEAVLKAFLRVCCGFISFQANSVSHLLGLLGLQVLAKSYSLHLSESLFALQAVVAETRCI